VVRDDDVGSAVAIEVSVVTLPSESVAVTL
jgi:hypothetical protein